jgi:hypothetical protein
MDVIGTTMIRQPTTQSPRKHPGCLGDFTRYPRCISDRKEIWSKVNVHMTGVLYSTDQLNNMPFYTAGGAGQ